MKIQRREIVTAILLSIITCGIYGIYWFIVMVDDIKAATNDETLPSGGTALLLSIITCGIYRIYLFYKMGKSLYNSKVSRDDNSILYLLLEIFGLDIVNLALVQNELNRTVTEEA